MNTSKRQTSVNRTRRNLTEQFSPPSPIDHRTRSSTSISHQSDSNRDESSEEEWQDEVEDEGQGSSNSEEENPIDTEGEDGVNMSAFEDTEDETSDPEMDAISFRKEYAALTKAAKLLGTELDFTQDFAGGSIMVIDNVEDGEKLATKIGCDPSKAFHAFQHALAVSETAVANVKKCGNTTSLFSAHWYLDVLIDMGKDEDGEYDPDILLNILDEDARTSIHKPFAFCPVSSHGHSLFNVSILNTPEHAQPKSPKKRKMHSRATFDKTSSTQHEVVNTQAYKDAQGIREENSLTKSLRQASELREFCHRKKVDSLVIYNYAVAKHSTTVPEFIKQLYEAALITRDGCAEIYGNVSSNECKEIDGLQLQIKAAEPPDLEEGEFRINRSQHILSFNSKFMKEFLQKCQKGSSQSQSQSKKAKREEMMKE